MHGKELKTIFPILAGLVGIAVFFQNEWLGTRKYIFSFLSRDKWLPKGGRRSGRVDIEENQAQGDVVKAQPEGEGWMLSLHSRNANYLFAGLRYEPWWKVSVDGWPVLPI